MSPSWTATPCSVGSLSRTWARIAPDANAAASRAAAGGDPEPLRSLLDVAVV
ncbi:hypothetical protein [Pseudonocardia phyllosphaerae]|uniref:hypothetical protein n=1 Tax=Pseudonocardia phyllosphaerae TaxID=3390502 RepID=UPI00397C1B65